MMMYQQYKRSQHLYNKTHRRKVPKLSSGKSRGHRYLPPWPFAIYPETWGFAFAVLYRESKTTNYDTGTVWQWK